MMRRRRPLARTAMVEGAAHYAGKEGPETSGSAAWRSS